MILVIIISTIFFIYRIDRLNKNKTLYLRIYSNNNTEWKSAYFTEEIYLEKFWERIVNLYSNDIGNEYIKFAENLKWKDTEKFPNRQADEVVDLSKGAVGLVKWKAWIYEEEKRVILYRYPNKKVEIDLSLYRSLSRKK